MADFVSLALTALVAAGAGSAIGYGAGRRRRRTRAAAPEGDATRPVSAALTAGIARPGKAGAASQSVDVRGGDPLTRLPNRAIVNERLESALAEAQADGRRVGLLLIDLDKFKEINDARGHTSGDRVLCAVAAALLQCASSVGMLARLASDEFALVVVANADDPGLTVVAGRIAAVLSQGFDIDGHTIRLSASIGVARAPVDGGDAQALFRAADAALESAKRAGGNQFRFHDPVAARAIHERAELAKALHGALDRDEFALLFQPIVALPGGAIIGAEALLRWKHPQRGLIGPDEFVDLAEENGAIVPIGEWVLEQACRTVARWNARGGSMLRVSVNVSPRQFVSCDLVQSVQRALAVSGCEPQWLMLEITESLLLEDGSQVRAALEALAEMGVAAAIDDFGTGYCGLSYLGKFPVRALKIDRSFVRGLEGDTHKLALVSAIVSMAHAFSLDVVAEGVETRSEAELLAALGCGKAQGYLFGRPMPAEQFDLGLEPMAS
ncbi:EAL domain-containing protein [Trinickia caryophylli]|uniref:Diguanylate cyclase (GGDEF) domain-containing protein n=1 Tax=Trinickia caryophylli TaxID=28094 RepID=A0A1X7GQF8_TRICW|nr:EAL domain-containing protein [Trinickia caryophylli]PMS10528.1 hypothetical protein C0Z17_19355 [Trinickia caryophylli]TRX19079.1 EAL domain-containing protein [Trinickia caryophylli]WQE10120.1 EAL domain-containing protein [Trinickia caryophylli]SMF73061.1 diguanylate cyclase (GGDEF) domain-containing protein [Trinickia caryophylli]GLU35141.1 hypothetical protein Busp01_49830 [Trinickia caryophylli]